MSRPVLSLPTLLAAAIPLALACAFSGCARQDKPARQRQPQLLAVMRAERHRLRTEIPLPGSFEAYQDVPIHAKVEGYVQWIGVDRGSIVKRGQRMIVVFAPEVDAKVREALSKVRAADAMLRQAQQALNTTLSRQVEAKAKLNADVFTYTRLKQAASRYAPAIAQNDLDVADQAVAADQARVEALNSEIRGARNLVVSEAENLNAAKNLYNAVKTMRSYLEIDAPFDGVISERNVHVGSIVSVSAARTGAVKPLVRVQEVDLLRLVVAVPEAAVAGVRIGDRIPFSVPAFPDKTLEGVVARPAYALEPKTRTMPVELNYWNRAFDQIKPGMYATVRWPMTRPYDSVFVPESAVRTNLKGSFVVKIEGGAVKQVKVKVGEPMGYMVEVMGDVREGDMVALRASDELTTGERVSVRLASRQEVEAASKLLGAGAE